MLQQVTSSSGPQLLGRLTIQDIQPAQRGSPHKFYAYASDLGFRVGYMPQLIPTDMGNQESFACYDVVRDREGDILAWKYRQSRGCLELMIFND